MRKQVGHALLRMILGVIFFAHGMTKWKKGLDSVADWFGSIGLPEFMAYLVTYVELFGGIALIVGVATRYVALLFACIMTGAILKVKLAAGLMGNSQMAGYELDLALLAMAVYLWLADGDNSFSVVHLFNEEKPKL